MGVCAAERGSPVPNRPGGSARPHSTGLTARLPRRHVAIGSLFVPPFRLRRYVLDTLRFSHHRVFRPRPASVLEVALDNDRGHDDGPRHLPALAPGPLVAATTRTHECMRAACADSEASLALLVTPGRGPRWPGDAGIGIAP